MKCTICRKADALYTRWERFRRFFFHFFVEDITDLSGEQFTKGFGEGYLQGFKCAKEQSKAYAQEVSATDSTADGRVFFTGR